MKKIIVLCVIVLFVGMGFQPAFAYNISMVDDSTPSDTWRILNSPEEEWNQTFGGYYDDWGYSVQQTTDGGYIITGGTGSYGESDGDFYLIKTDSNGNKIWHKTFGDIWYDKSFSVTQTSDGGYIITGLTCPIFGWANVWLIKTDSNGNKVWDKTFGGDGLSGGRSVSETSDGGFIITGYTSSSVPGFADVWLIKTDSYGNKAWDQTYGGNVYDCGMLVKQTGDGGYIIIGITESYGAGMKDVWLIKTGSNGNKMWDKTFGGASDDGGYSVSQISDGGYIITGYTRSFGAGSRDVWLIKTDSTGNKVWDRTFGGPDYDDAWCVQQTTDGGYIITGWTNSFGAGNDDVWLIKVRTENQPPEAPKVWWSPKYPKPFELFNLTFNSIDPDGNDVRFYIEWGDGDSEWTIWAASGTNITKSHKAGPKGTYYINVTAQDGNGAMSDVTTVKIIVGKSKAVNVEDKLLDSNYKDYWNCRIRAKPGVDGKAFLFPGFLSSWSGLDSSGVEVKRAFGILKNEYDDWSTDKIHFNNDYYFHNWTKAYVFSFTGYFHNYYYLPWRLFEIDGTAFFVRVFI